MYMAEICTVCGLPKDLCVCETISMEQQLIKVRLETRKWGKSNTVIEGFDDKNINMNDLAAKLKTVCACGGTAKNNAILLQGDHREKVKKILIQQGFPEKIIEVH